MQEGFWRDVRVSIGDGANGIAAGGPLKPFGGKAKGVNRRAHILLSSVRPTLLWSTVPQDVRPAHGCTSDVCPS